MSETDIPSKASRVMKWILLAFLLILARVAFLALFQHEKYVETAKRPQRRVRIEKPYRGTISDRFNIPLAVNKSTYDVSVIFDPIRDFPSIKWEKGVKIRPRKEYIRSFSEKLSEVIGVQATEIEDLLYSKAAIFPHTPFILKDHLDEKTYFTIKGLERDWPGLLGRCKAERFYPRGKSASHLIGYMGSIDTNLFHSIAEESALLKGFLSAWEAGEAVVLPKGYESVEAAAHRLENLKDLAYSINDSVGKMGIEARFDQELKGKIGKQLYGVDAKGRILDHLSDSYPPTSGNRISLTISAELQEFAEQLLAENEKIRSQRFPVPGVTPPWIKGGAIVAMIPSTGEVVACASYPQFDPNDFISSSGEIGHWLESRRYIGEIWDGKQSLERDLYDTRTHRESVEKEKLSWSRYLDYVLSAPGKTRQSLNQVRCLAQGKEIQTLLSTLVDLSEQPQLSVVLKALYEDTPLDSLAQHIEQVEWIKKQLDPFLAPIHSTEDRLAFVDFLNLALTPLSFSPDLLSWAGKDTIEMYREFSQAVAILSEAVKSSVKTLYLQTDFLKWREREFEAFLKAKRRQEKEEKRYERPYLDYLHEVEKERFRQFWTELKPLFIQGLILDHPQIFCEDEMEKYLAHLKCLREELISSESAEGDALRLLSTHLKVFPTEIANAYIETMPSFEDLNTPLLGTYKRLGKTATLQDLAKAFYPQHGFHLMNSFAYTQATPLGSIYKTIVGYEALKQHYYRHNCNPPSLSPMTIVDDTQPHLVTPHGMVLGYTESGEKITRRYKGGRLPKTHARIGKIDFQGALERSSNIYYSLLASEIIEHPEDLIRVTKDFGLGSKTGIDLPGEFAGMIPEDIYDDKSALYSFAIGQHTLLATPVQTAAMLSALATGGALPKPQILLSSMGSDGCFPLVHETLPQIVRHLQCPKDVLYYLFAGLRRVFDREGSLSRLGGVRYLLDRPAAMRIFSNTKKDLIGKTSTAEISYRPFLDRESETVMCTHTWFGAIAFTPSLSPLADFYSQPELVVTVYLQYGDWGKEAAPLAALVVDKWRQLCAIHERSAAK